MASSYQPILNTTAQISDSRPLHLTYLPPIPASPKSGSSAVIPYVPESSIPELPMHLGNRKNTEGTGIGDSQHASKPSSAFSNPSFPPPSSHPSSSTKHPSTWSPSQDIKKKKWSTSLATQVKEQCQRSVRFSSPLATFAPAHHSRPSTIPGTSSGNATVSETPPHIKLGQLLENEGATPEHSGLSQEDLNRPIVVKELINLMVVLEDGMETKMKEMEERILAAIRVKTQGPPSYSPRILSPTPTRPENLPLCPKSQPHSSVEPGHPAYRTSLKPDHNRSSNEADLGCHHGHRSRHHWVQTGTHQEEETEARPRHHGDSSPLHIFHPPCQAETPPDPLSQERTTSRRSKHLPNTYQGCNQQFL